MFQKSCVFFCISRDLMDMSLDRLSFDSTLHFVDEYNDVGDDSDDNDDDAEIHSTTR